jgi:hypothetical protein
MARGKKERRGKFRDFWDAIKKAEAEAVFDRVQCIKAASDKGTWQAAAWWLERRYPDEFSSDKRTIRELAKMIARLTAPARAKAKPGPGARDGSALVKRVINDKVLAE